MKNLSIYTFLNTLFFIIMITLIVVFSIFIKIDNQQYKISQEQRYELIAKNFNTKSHFTKSFNLEKILNNNLRLNILNNAKVLYHDEYQNLRIRVFNLNNIQYIYIQKLGINLVFRDKASKKADYHIYTNSFIVGLIFFIILVLYLMLLKKLQPLKELNDTIVKFSKGDLNTKVNIDTKDEIGQIASNFNQAIKNINLLINSKNLFMRNIMHELKTPLTKGIFLTTMIETKQIDDKQLLLDIFHDMNNTLTQLAQIEKLKTNFLQVTKETINIKNILDDLIKKLNIKNCIVEIEENSTVIANKELFITLIKNLLTNSDKYSSDHQIFIAINQKQIAFKTKGQKLKKDLEYYTQPFTQESKNQDGLGLGLYIIYEIARLHNFKLTYQYNNQSNIFSILLI